jgi:hypothetical protein
VLDRHVRILYEFMFFNINLDTLKSAWERLVAGLSQGMETEGGG